MDVVVGVAVAGRVARLAMIGPGGQVFDQYALDLPDDAMTDLAETIVGTYREVADSGNRVAATRLCLPDASTADTLRRTVLDAGVPNVEVVSETDAAASLAVVLYSDGAAEQAESVSAEAAHAAERVNAYQELGLALNCQASALIELARTYGRPVGAPPQSSGPKHQLIFVSTDGGAFGGLGAERFIERFSGPRRIVAVVNLDAVCARSASIRQWSDRGLDADSDHDQRQDRHDAAGQYFL